MGSEPILKCVAFSGLYSILNSVGVRIGVTKWFISNTYHFQVTVNNPFDIVSKSLEIPFPR